LPTAYLLSIYDEIIIGYSPFATVMRCITGVSGNRQVKPPARTASTGCVWQTRV
jgi:hypothetical protein